MPVRYVVGDSLSVVRTLPDASVDAVMTSSPYFAKRSYLPGNHPAKAKEIGQEATPADFLETLLSVADELGRVLAPWGSMWWNLGDTAAFSGGSGGDYLPGGLREGQATYEGTADRSTRWARTKDGYPLAKSVCWVPQLFGASLAYGRNLLTGTPCRQWVTRPPVTWCKENPAVGEIIDACRVATELVIFASPSGRYFFDLDAVRTEPTVPYTGTTNRGEAGGRRGGGDDKYEQHKTRSLAGNPLGAPPRDWWVVNTAQYPGSHYAVMPVDLLEIPMRAAVPERVCSVCSLPWERLVICERCGASGGNSYRRLFRRSCTCPKDEPRPWRRTAGWVPPCEHGAWRRAVVLDPFGGAGTTGLAAVGHGHDALLVDLDERNAELAADRLGMFLTVDTASRSAVDVPGGRR